MKPWPHFPHCPGCRRRLHSETRQVAGPTPDGRCPHCGRIMTDRPIPTEQLVHAPDCAGPKITRRDAIGYSSLSCSTCGAHARVPARREWADRG